MSNLSHIAENLAKWAVEGEKISGLLSERTIRREWVIDNQNYLQELAEILRQRTSLKNPDDKKKYYMVSDPMVDGKEYPGIWRGTLVEIIKPDEKKTGRIIQELRYGWLETLVDGAGNVDFAEARIRQGRFLQDQPTGSNTSSDEKYLEVYWPSCSNEKLKTMVNQLGASTFTDPTIEGEVQTGTWRNNLVVPTTADDGSKIITMYLGIAHFRLDGFADYISERMENTAYLWGYSKDTAQAIGDAWKVSAGKGSGCRFSYDRSTGLVDITLTQRIYTSYSSYTGVTSDYNCRYKETEDYYFGVTDPTLYVITGTPANGVSYSRRLRNNGDGSWDVIITTRTVQYRDIAYQVSEISGMASVETRQQLGLTTETQADMSSEDGKIKRQVVEVRDDCSKDVITKKETGINIEKTSYDHDALVKRTITDNTINTSALSEPSPTAGQAIQVVNQPSEYPGRTKTRRVVEEAQYILGTEYVARYGEQSTDYLTDVEHDTAYPAITDSTASGVETAVLSHDTDKYLTHNYKKMRSVKKYPISDADNVSGISWTVYGDIELATAQTYSSTLGRYWNSSTLVYQRIHTHTMKFFRTAAEAAAFITGSDGVGIDKSGSTFSHTGEFEWMAIKVVLSKTLITTYTYTEPTS